MSKKLIFGSLGVLLLITGCSKQPNLENAANSSTNNQNTTTNVAKQQIVGEKATVNTQNAEVQTENIESQNNLSNTNSAITNNNQQFAKNVASIVIHFDFDKYNIKPSEWPKVEKLAKMIKSNNKNYTIRIEGNCDEWGTEEYNYALGLRRANSVRSALIKLGVDPKKLTVISYGKLNPVCTAHARWCWRKNRRDNFTYLP